MNLSLGRVLKSEAGWYRGDFHAHSTFSSDGHNTPLELLDIARAEGLDFFAITDHNAIAAFDHFGTPDDLVVIPGIEVTLRLGHFNIFGIENESCWLAEVCADAQRYTLEGEFKTPNQILHQIGQENLLASINHPLRQACQWLDEQTDLRHLHCLEIWNKPSFPQYAAANRESVALWSRMLNAGYRITAIGGSDYHRPVPHPNHGKLPEHLGEPSTYVFAESLSGRDILTGLQRRRAYVSMGAEVDFKLYLGQQCFRIGADLPFARGEACFSAEVDHSPEPGLVRILRNNHPIAERPIAAGEACRLEVQTHIDATRPAWYRLDVCTPDGALLAVTNPIYTGPRLEPEAFAFGDFL